MRTADEIKAQLRDYEGMEIDEEDLDSQNMWGQRSGLKRALRMTLDSKTTADILAYAQADDATYHSHGDDYADAYQSGYSTALYWAAEQFDWDAEGVALFRPGNIWNEAPAPGVCSTQQGTQSTTPGDAADAGTPAQAEAQQTMEDDDETA